MSSKFIDYIAIDIVLEISVQRTFQNTEIKLYFYSLVSVVFGKCQFQIEDESYITIELCMRQKNNSQVTWSRWLFLRLYKGVSVRCFEIE